MFSIVLKKIQDEFKNKGTLYISQRPCFFKMVFLFFRNIR